MGAPSEKITPDLQLASGGLLNLLSQFVGLGTSFLIGVLVARLLGPQGRGELSVLMQVPAVLIIVLGLGISTANTYFVSTGKTPAGLALGNSLALAIPAAVVGVPLAILFLLGPLSVLPGLPVRAVAFAAVAVPLGLLASWLAGVSAGVGRLRLNLRYSVVSSLVTLAGIAVLFALDGASLTAVVGFSVGGTLAGIAVVFAGLRRWARPVRVDLGTVRNMTRYSSKTYAAGLAGYLHLRQDVLLLGWLAGASSVGLYSVGVSFAELLWYVPAALAGVIFARAGRHDEAAALDYVARSSRISVLLMVVSAALGAIAVPVVIALLFGRAFLPSTWVFYALIPGVLGDGVARVVMSFQMATGRVYWRESLGSTGLNLLANLLLIPLIGFVGAALASSISYVALAALVLWRLKRDTSAEPLAFLVPRRDDVRVVLRAVREAPGRFAPTRGDRSE